MLALVVIALVASELDSLLKKTVWMPPVWIKLTTLVTCFGLGLELGDTFLTSIRARPQCSYRHLHVLRVIMTPCLDRPLSAARQAPLSLLSRPVYPLQPVRQLV